MPKYRNAGQVPVSFVSKITDGQPEVVSLRPGDAAVSFTVHKNEQRRLQTYIDQGLVVQDGEEVESVAGSNEGAAPRTDATSKGRGR
jgi:hypothetical protein